MHAFWRFLATLEAVLLVTPPGWCCYLPDLCGRESCHEKPAKAACCCAGEPAASPSKPQPADDALPPAKKCCCGGGCRSRRLLPASATPAIHLAVFELSPRVIPPLHSVQDEEEMLDPGPSLQALHCTWLC